MVTDKKPPSIRWEYNQSNRIMSIPFNEIPCMLLVAQDYQCHQRKTCIKLARSTTNKTRKFGNHAFGQENIDLSTF